jgi:2-polyprenyl-3-methyl-5-hydroxy-6-metoxy-1,4-benzoquinol methylase
MNKKSLNMQKTTNNTDKKLYNYLLNLAEKRGFSEAKKEHWAYYMMETSRAEKTINYILSDFQIKDTENSKVLDIGCGYGSLIVVLKQFFQEVYGIEIESERVEWAQKRTPSAEIICGSATTLPWQDEYFELILSTDVLEHIPYKEQQMVASELMRVLKPGGKAYLELPNRLQILDEHNRILFGTYFPDKIREKYVEFFSRNSYCQCWERTGRGWKSLFENQGFKVELEAHYPKGLKFLKYFLIPANRYKIYLTK